jgi:pyruvate dehydrogenase E1 component
VVRTLSELARRGEVDAGVVQTAIDRYDLNNPSAGQSGTAGGDS